MTWSIEGLLLKKLKNNYKFKEIKRRNINLYNMTIFIVVLYFTNYLLHTHLLTPFILCHLHHRYRF